MPSWVVALIILALSAGCSNKREPAPEPTAERLPTEDAGRGPRLEYFATSRDAFARVLTAKPRVLGVGEFHTKKGGAKLTSALARFTRELLPDIHSYAGEHKVELVLETWAPRGSDTPCGEASRQVSASVDKGIERPEAVKSELVELVEAAKKLGIRPHAMQLSCDDYRIIQPAADVAVDYAALLSLITRKLGEQARALRSSDHIVVLYGGSLHNDRYPRAGTEGWSYARTLENDAGYVELDLYLPELIRADKLESQEPWFEAAQRPGRTKFLLVERAPDSFILVFPKARPAAVSDPAATR